MINNSLTTKYRMGRLESDVKVLDTKIDKMLINDLPHINEQIISMKTRISVSTGINIFGFIAVIIGIILLVK